MRITEDHLHRVEFLQRAATATGFQTAALGKVVRLGELAADVPVVFVTAYPERCYALQSTGRGAVAVVSKPFRLDEIRQAMARALAP